MEETTSIKDIIKIIKGRLLLIISLTIFSVGIAIVWNFYIVTPLYQSQTQILLNSNDNNSNDYSWTQIETDIYLIDTYNDIITSTFILSKVIERLQLDITPEQLSSQITLSSESGSKVFEIEVVDSIPERAANIANKTAEVFKEEIPLLLNVDNINILAPAKINLYPISPNKTLNIAIGAVIGVMLGVGLACLIEILDTTIKDEKDVVEILNIPIMGIVGKISLEREKKTSLKTQRLRGVQNVWVEK